MTKCIFASFVASDSSPEGGIIRAKHSKFLIPSLFLLAVSLILVACGSSPTQQGANEATTTNDSPAVTEVAKSGEETADGEIESITELQEDTSTQTPTPTQIPEPTAIPSATPVPSETPAPTEPPATATHEATPVVESVAMTPVELAEMMAGFDPEYDLELLTPENGLGPIYFYVMHHRRGDKVIINEQTGGLQIKNPEPYREATLNYIENLNREGIVAIVDANQLENYDIATDEDGEPRIYTTPQGVTYAWLESPGIQEFVYITSPDQSLGFTGSKQTTWVDYGANYAYFLTPEGQLVLYHSNGSYHGAHFDNPNGFTIPKYYFDTLRLAGTNAAESWRRITTGKTSLRDNWPNSSERIDQLNRDLFGKSEAEMNRIFGPERVELMTTHWQVDLVQIRP